MFLACFSPKRVLLFHLFSTLRGNKKSRKSRHIYSFRCLSTVSAGTTNITIYYLYHSFVIALRAKESERVPRKEICYEDYIQPPKRKRCSGSLDVRRIRQVHTHRG